MVTSNMNFMTLSKACRRFLYPLAAFC